MVVTIVAWGDVPLTSGATKFLVSSKCLAAVSPYFDRMFDSTRPFREAKEIVQTDKLPVEVQATVQNPAVVRLFVDVAHHRALDIDIRPSPSCLVDLAMLCDEYDTTGPFRFHSAEWLRQDLTSLIVDDCWRLLLFAYVMKLKEGFSAISAEIMLRQGAVMMVPAWLLDHPLMEQNLQGMSGSSSGLMLIIRANTIKHLVRLRRFSTTRGTASPGQGASSPTLPRPLTVIRDRITRVCSLSLSLVRPAISEPEIQIIHK